MVLKKIPCWKQPRCPSTDKHMNKCGKSINGTLLGREKEDGTISTTNR